MSTSVKQVLLVDDEEPFLDSLADGLSVYRKFFQIRTAINGAEAVKVLKLHPVDLVVTGLSMPKMDGFELFAYMSRNYPQIPVIIMTAYSTPKIEKICKDMGAFRFMEKPLEILKLAENIFDGLKMKMPGALSEKDKMGVSADRKIRILQNANMVNDLMKGFYEPAIWYAKEGRYGEAIFCLIQLLERSADIQNKTESLYALGQIMEQMGKFEDAISYYREASVLCPRSSGLLYWINNNTGYSLYMLGRHKEAEKYCRIAIEIDINCANAFKNLGLALEGQGRLRESIDAYITATKVNAKDARAANFLEKLLKKHPELNEEYNESLEECRTMVECAKQDQEEPKQVH